MQIDQPLKRLPAGEIGKGRLLIISDALSRSLKEPVEVRGDYLRLPRCVLRQAKYD